MGEVFEIIFKIALVLGLPLGSIPLILQVERRGAAFIQKRLGPNRVGPFGLLQPLADVVKFLFKEEVVPSHVNKYFYVLAPILTLIVALMPLAGVPLFGPVDLGGEIFYPEVFRSPLGIFYVFAASALGAYGVLMAGWASNNKYSMLGAIRASAQMISYELSLSVTMVAIFLYYGNHDIHAMVAAQNEPLFWIIPSWGILVQPLGALIFLVGIFAESNRLPFDLAEGESEIVGYHVEYSSMKFALFFMAEYVHMFVLSCLFIFIFLGGYNLLPGMAYIADFIPFGVQVLQVASMVIKVAFMMWFFIWVRWSLPRLRYDQLMSLGWKQLLPLGLVNLVITVVIVYYRGQ